MVKQYVRDLKREFHGYNAGKLIKDLLSGVTVAAVALPLALAFGVSSGATPAAGLVTAILGGVVIGLLGGASFQISGPTGAMSAILITIVAQYGLQGVFVASLAAGVVILLCGVFRLGKLVSFIPTSVVMGFTSGIAIIIALGQVDNFFGTTSEGASALEKLASYARLGFHPQWQAMAVGLFVVLFMVFWPKKWNEKVPGSLVSIIAATVLTGVLGFDQLATVGEIPRSLMLSDRLNPAQLDLSMLGNLVSPIISIAALAMIESLLCGASASRMKDEPFDANRELIAQGVGNILLPFFGGVPATAAIARTSVAIKSGEQTRLAGVFHSLFLLLSMLLLGGVMARLPLSALAGVLMVTAWRMNEWHGIRTIFSRRVYTGIAQFLITMLATVVFDLTVAILIGIVCAALMFIMNATRLTVESASLDTERMWRVRERGGNVPEEELGGIRIVYVNGSLFFANTAELKRRLSAVDLSGCKQLIISLRGVSATDISGVQTLMECCAGISEQGVSISLSGVHENVRRFFDQMGLTEQLGADHYFSNASEAAVAAVNHMRA
ncbi:MAG: SulP family inorganic anion transporter [bacterium]|nr:SulP family inorganic anion transporter [bacterium]